MEIFATIAEDWLNWKLKCLNSLLIALHSFRPLSIFLREIYKIEDYEFFKKKKIDILRKENMFLIMLLSKSKFFTRVTIVPLV